MPADGETPYEFHLQARAPMTLSKVASVLALSLILTVAFPVVAVAVVVPSREVKQEEYLLRRTLHP